MSKSKGKKQDTVQGSEHTIYKLFYVLSILMLLYMAFSAVTSYQSFSDYCASYNYQMSDQWFIGFQSILAAVIPCLVYACTLYGIGYLIKSLNNSK